MFGNIVITILVISACSGESPISYYSMAGNKALSSHSFQRDDVPLSYKYNSVHLYSSPPPDHDTLDHQPHHYNLNPTNFINIQYAPLVKPSSRLYTKVHSPHEMSIRNYENIEAVLKLPSTLPSTSTVKTDHLEPRFVPTRTIDLQPQPLSHLDYIPGHNIEVLRSVNRSPGSNAVFKNYSPSASPGSFINTLPQKMVNFLTPYKVNHPMNQRRLEMSTKNIIFSLATERTTTNKITTTTTTTTQPITTTTMLSPPIYRDYSYNFPENHQQLILPKPIIYNIVDMPTVKKASAVVNTPPQQQKSPYMKMHTLLLNVARAYNMAFAPHKTVLHSGTNPAMLGIIQPYAQTYMRAPRLPQSMKRTPSNQKTILYPIQKNLRFAIHS